MQGMAAGEKKEKKTKIQIAKFVMMTSVNKITENGHRFLRKEILAATS